ncbi:Putative WD repeat-containing protein WDR44/Dgr2 [Septoria linicola]|uniref:WD repeat-containing protein WDR44/Dgr2 n=1 Tax=Septoria linicola TaxID=215465 RepID=A0A9Q9EGU3_9PEZI|nr:Putative WD repeat-containing protein WDR44/Dgr2 [Septoria linicola]
MTDFHHVPAITLTDPQNQNGVPSPAQSPVKENGGFTEGLTARVGGRPSTPGKHGRPDSSSGWASPGRLIRTLSQNTSAGAATSNGHSRDDVNKDSNSSASKQQLHEQAAESPGIDPLSQHILRRTNAPQPTSSNNNSPRPRTVDGRSQYRDDDKSQSGQDEQRAISPGSTFDPPSRTDTNDTAVADRDRESRKDLKKGVKAVSFLSRLSRLGGTKKQKDATEEEMPEDEDNTSEDRPEGNDAEVFTQQVDNMGFNPRHPQPPAYIKVRAKHKKQKDFDRLFLAQELSCKKKFDMPRQNSSNKLRRKTSATPDDSNTVWAMEFSRDGKYLAAAGADKIVRVWAVLGSSDDRMKHERQEALESEAKGRGMQTEHLSAPVFQSTPIREYEGHSSTVLDLSWSKNNFLLSSSMDKTVRLWHVTRNECLCTFKHNDFVPSIAFHPKDDRFFLAGSLDSKLRLWSIPDKNVAFAAQVPDMITAVAFTPDGKCAMAGCLGGLCMFFETEGLRYQTQIHVRSTRGQNAKGSKITGIQAFNAPAGDTKILITSNDSRIRLYNFRDKSLELKFRGNENNCSQIRASLSDDGRYIACGSEDKKAYIWSLHPTHGEKRDKTPVEMFDAHNSIATAVCVAPPKTRQHLSKSEDPVYDICNPPPITLLSHAERSGAESMHSSSRPQSVTGSIAPTPPDFERPKESPQYLARSGHKEGNIIVTADFSGKIKVFRQDCAWSKRQRDDDRASMFSKRSTKAGGTRSLASKPSLTSLREPRRSTSTMAGSDRVLSWRQDISSTSTVAEARSSSKTYPPSRSSTKASSRNRSPSPKRSMESNRRGRTMPAAVDRSASARQAQTQPHPLAADAMVRSPSPISREPTNGSATNHKNLNDSPTNTSRSQLSAKEKEKEEKNPMSLDQGGRSYVFWDQQIWQEHANRINDLHRSQDELPSHNSSGQPSPGTHPDHLAVQRPPLSKISTTGTYVSKLSDELTDEDSEAEQYEDAREDEEQCMNCGGSSLAATRTKDGTRLVCTSCGRDA